MEYGLIKDTTIQGIADSFREKDIVPKYERDEFTIFKYKSDNATSLDDPTPTEPKKTALRIIIPEAAKLRLELTLACSNPGGGNLGVLYVYKADTTVSYNSYMLGYQTPPTITMVADGNDIRIETGSQSVHNYYAFTVNIYPLDANGNPMTIYRDSERIAKYKPEELVEAINECPKLPPEYSFRLTGNITNLCAGGWDWFFDFYKDKITTEALTNLGSSFDGTKINKFNFVFNIANANYLSYTFRNMALLEESPKLRGVLDVTRNLNLDNFITGCSRIKSFEDLFTDDMLKDFNTIQCTGAYSCAKPIQFRGCTSLRTVPTWWYNFRLCEDSTAFPNYSYTIYYNMVGWCNSLDEIVNIPVWKCNAAQTTNMFNTAFDYAVRLKDITFETNDGQPIEVKWKTQTINLTTVGAGVGGGAVTVEQYSQFNGITKDKKVIDDATYQALKNDPDWYTEKPEYSRYDHDSAVRTINSLPDTSAYLASAGGTNTIKFTKNFGANTDAGAIETLTAEEIAVAAAKGWTVSLV